ncbi:MAG: hypothetical protein L6Q92_16315 [Phycisphaerae bacterium]|nr:hypothetical protein [Phycisphaerae bacterium]
MINLRSMRATLVALVLVNSVARWCDVSCCTPGAGESGSCGAACQECCADDATAPDAIASTPADPSSPAQENSAPDDARPACSAVCCAKVLVAPGPSPFRASPAPLGWASALVDAAPEPLSLAGVFHPPRA